MSRNDCRERRLEQSTIIAVDEDGSTRATARGDVVRPAGYLWSRQTGDLSRVRAFTSGLRWNDEAFSEELKSRERRTSQRVPRTINYSVPGTVKRTSSPRTCSCWPRTAPCARTACSFSMSGTPSGAWASSRRFQDSPSDEGCRFRPKTPVVMTMRRCGTLPSGKRLLLRRSWERPAAAVSSADSHRRLPL